jgi:hypothetical protein
MIEHLPSIHKTLGLISSTRRTKRRRRKRRRRKRRRRGGGGRGEEEERTLDVVAWHKIPSIHPPIQQIFLYKSYIA